MAIEFVVIDEDSIVCAINQVSLGGTDSSRALQSGYCRCAIG